MKQNVGAPSTRAALLTGLVVAFLALTAAGRDPVQPSPGFETCTDDAYEPDDTLLSAHAIAVGETQTHRHCDPDWVTFPTTSNAIYAIETRSLLGGADTVVEVQECSWYSDYCRAYRTLGQDDDGGPEDRASRVVFRGFAGKAFASVTERGDRYVDGMGYDVSVSCVAGCPGQPATLVVPVVSRSTDEAGTLRAAPLTLLNTGYVPTDVRLAFQPTDSDEAARLVRTLRVPAGETLVVPDLLGTVFGRSAALGSLFITTDAESVVAWSGDVRATPVKDTLVSGSVNLFDLGRAGGETVRVGLCETSGGRAQVTVKLVDDAGVVLGKRLYTLPRYGHHEVPDVFGELGVEPRDGMRAEVASVGGRAFAYATIVDRLGTETFVPGRFGLSSLIPLFRGSDRRVVLTNPGPFSNTVYVEHQPSGDFAIVPLGPGLSRTVDLSTLFASAPEEGTIRVNSLASTRRGGPAATADQPLQIGGGRVVIPLDPGRHPDLVLLSGTISKRPSVVKAQIAFVGLDGRTQERKTLSFDRYLRIEDVLSWLGQAPEPGSRLELELEPNGTFGRYESAFAYTVDPVDGRTVHGGRSGVLSNAVTFTLPGDTGLEMLRLPGGTFFEGSPETEAGRDGDEERHPVTLRQPVLMQKIELTERQWSSLMKSGRSSETPVTNVSWDEIAGPGGFLERLNAWIEETGQGGWGRFRLPTEAEWERAARDYTDTSFPFDLYGACDLSCGPCYGAGSIISCGTGLPAPRPAGTYTVNSLGFFNLLGNVWEWTSDFYAPFGPEPLTDPTGPSEGSERVIKGGGYSSELRLARPANRFSYPTDGRYPYVGFRVVLAKD